MKLKVHFVGIKGVGVCPLAIIAKEAGFEVTGSDVSEEFITDEFLRKAGIEPFVGFKAEHVVGADLVIATGAHGGVENPEVVEAKNLGIEVLSQGAALAKFQRGEMINRKLKGISVAGSHGKTTTTAIIATMLKEIGMDPSFSIGTGEIPSLGSPGHLGKGDYFVAEADEYVVDVVHDSTKKFLLQKPLIEVVTNIDFDHADIYPSIVEVRDAFLEFANLLPEDGVLIACGDGEENRKFLELYKGRRTTYGSSPQNDIYLERVNFSEDKMFFWVSSKGALLGEFSMNVFGEHNAINALGAIAVGIEIGLPIDQIRKGIAAFKGTKRRSEFKGTIGEGTLVYDDYGHHPKEIEATLKSFRKAFPKKDLVCIFQPHMYSRTKALFSDFVSSFEDANEVVFLEIFPSFREPIDPNFSSRFLQVELEAKGKKATYFPTIEDVVEYVASQNYDRNTVVITMGAGDVYKVGEGLLGEQK